MRRASMPPELGNARRMRKSRRLDAPPARRTWPRSIISFTASSAARRRPGSNAGTGGGALFERAASFSGASSFLDALPLDAFPLDALPLDGCPFTGSAAGGGGLSTATSARSGPSAITGPWPSSAWSSVTSSYVQSARHTSSTMTSSPRSPPADATAVRAEAAPAAPPSASSLADLPEPPPDPSPEPSPEPPPEPPPEPRLPLSRPSADGGVRAGAGSAEAIFASRAARHSTSLRSLRRPNTSPRSSKARR